MLTKKHFISFFSTLFSIENSSRFHNQTGSRLSNFSLTSLSNLSNTNKTTIFWVKLPIVLIAGLEVLAAPRHVRLRFHYKLCHQPLIL